MTIKFPCKDCTSRKTSCHSNCAKYLQAKAELQRRKDLAQEEKDSDLLYMAYKCGKTMR